MYHGISEILFCIPSTLLMNNKTDIHQYSKEWNKCVQKYRRPLIVELLPRHELTILSKL